MKKLLFASAVFILFAASNDLKAQTSNFNAVENQLYAAANNPCLNAWRQAYGGRVHFETNAVAILDCLNGNVGYSIEIYAYFTCPPQIAEFCRPRGPVHVATATRNCDGSTTVNCITAVN